MRLDGEKQIATVGLRSGGQLPPIGKCALELQQTAIKTRVRDRWREIADQRRSSTALSKRTLGRIVRGIEVEIRHVADQSIWPAVTRQACLLARHELERAVRSEMQDSVRAEILTKPAIERRERVGRREALFEQEPHRIALVTERGLHTDEDVAERHPENLDGATVALVLAGRRPPMRLDLVKPSFALYDLIGRYARMHIGDTTEPPGIALENARAQCVDRLRHLDGVSGAGHRTERVEERLEDSEIGGRTRSAGVRRKIEYDDRYPAITASHPAQRYETINSCCKTCNPLGLGLHILAITRRGRAPTEDKRASRTIELRDRDHDRRLDR